MIEDLRTPGDLLHDGDRIQVRPPATPGLLWDTHWLVEAAVHHHGSVLQARSLSVEIGGRLTLVEASFTVRAGEKVGLVGRNGAGKTTMLKVLGGEREASAGVVLRQGALGYLPQDPRPQGAGVDATALSHVLSGRGLDEAVRRVEKLRLTMEEDASERNVARYSRAQERFEADGGYGAESEVRRICAGLGLTADRVDLPLAVLSGGERRRVEIARSLVIQPSFLLLDEPFSGIDPIQVLELQKIIFDLKNSGIGILMTDHNVRETLAVTDRAYIINNGRIFRSGSPESLGNDPEVRRVYLGEHFSMGIETTRTPRVD